MDGMQASAPASRVIGAAWPTFPAWHAPLDAGPWPRCRVDPRGWFRMWDAARIRERCRVDADSVARMDRGLSQPRKVVTPARFSARSA